jgi:hypothetical protein
VQRDARPRRLADVLHDVDLAGIGPPSVAERPERRPQPGAHREFHPRGGGAIGETELRPGLDAAGNEIERASFGRLESGAVARPDRERAVLD